MANTVFDVFHTWLDVEQILKNRWRPPTVDPLSWTSVSGKFLSKLPGKRVENRGQRREIENQKILIAQGFSSSGFPGSPCVGALPKLDVAGSTPVARSTLSLANPNGAPPAFCSFLLRCPNLKCESICGNCRQCNSRRIV